jgi:acetyl esterase
MEFFWRHYLGSPEDHANPLAAPLLADLTGLGPLRLQVAELDVLHDENLALADKARAQGVATEAEVYPGVTHGFLRAVGHVETSARAIRDGADWLRRIAGI